MRFCVELLLKNPRISKEKNKLISHIMKLLFQHTDPRAYSGLYELEENKEKDFTFSTYLGRGAKFNRDDIFIPEQKIILNFSTYDIGEGILFYNSFVNSIGLELPIEDNIITVNEIRKSSMGAIEEDIVFVSKSPIVVREHRGDNKTTWYHDLSSQEGYEVFMENLAWQLKTNLDNIALEDIDSMKVEILDHKMVKVKHYGITIPSNLVSIRVLAKAYIVDYIYKAGLGSRRSQGFGYLDIV